MRPYPLALVLGAVAAVAGAGCHSDPASEPSPPTQPTVGRVINREKALAELERTGAFLKTQGEGPERKLIEVDFRSVTVGDEGLRLLPLFPELKFVGLLGCPVTDAGMEHLRPLSDLETIVLGGTRITDAGFAVVAEWPQLRRLEFQSTRVTDTGLVHLKKLKGLGYVKAGGTRITDAGMQHISEIVALEYLNLVQTRVGDSGVERLAGMRTLKALYLDGCRVTDLGVAHLKVAKELEVLSVRETSVTAEGAIAVQEGRPNLQVIR